MITPRYPAGEIRVEADDIVIKIRSSIFTVSLESLSRSWNLLSPPAVINDHEGHGVGNIERIDKDFFGVAVHLHRYKTPVVDLMKVIHWQQKASPLIDAEPGQMVLEGVMA